MTELESELTRAREHPLQVAKAVVGQVRDDDIPFMAGSIAYQAFASLVPLLVLLFLAMTVLGDQQLAQRIVVATEGVLPDSAQTLVRNAILSEGGVGGAGASVIGVVTVVWGSLKIFRGLDKAFSEIYETAAENTLVDQVRDGVVVLAVLGIAVVGMLGAMSVFAVFGPLSRVLSFLALVVGLTLAFIPMYALFPDADLTWADALPGAVVAAVGWVGLQFLFQLYVQFASRGDSSGVLGAVLLLLLWLYFSGLVLLFAAVVNAVLLGEGASPAADADDGGTPDTADGVRTRTADRIGDRREEAPWQPAAVEGEPDRDSAGTAADADPAVERSDGTGAEPTPDPERSALRRRNRALERRLYWQEQPLRGRLRSRLFGDGPPSLPERPSRDGRPGDDAERG